MESPFTQHLHTNHVPTDVEVECIRTLLMPHSEEVLRLEALIQDLTSQREKLVDYIASHKAFISLVR